MSNAHHLARTWLWLALAICLAGCPGRGPTDPGPTDGTVTDGADVAIDAGAGPLAHCGPLGPLPWWAEARSPATGIVGRCQGHDLHVTALDDGVLRLTYTAVDGMPPGRSWAVTSATETTAVALGGVNGDALVCTAHLAVRVAAESCRITLRDAAGTTLIADGADGGWRTGMGTVDGVPTATSVVTRDTPSTERFYGLGEHTGPFERRGTFTTLWNTDAYDVAHGGYGPDQDPLYQSIPLLIGLRDSTAYGVLTDNPHRMEVDLARAEPDRYSITTYGGDLDQLVIAGPRISEVLRRYTGLTGRMPLPPRWALGYHQCRWGYSPDTRLHELASEFRTRQIPADGLWLDIQHLDGFRTFTWDPVAFPDPAGLTAALAADGFKVTVIADPGIKVDPGWSVYDSGLARDVFLREPGGDVYVGSVWPGDSAFPDFTAPEARAWWGELVGSLVDVGVRGIWLDVNEPSNFPESGDGNTVPNGLPVDGDGVPTTMAEAHNVYALNEARATYEGMRAAAPGRRPFLLTRAGYAGIQRYAAAWTGDAPSTWESLAQTLPMLLNMGLSGEAFVGSDVGGYSGGASPELFARWMGVGAISPFFRGHVTSGVNDQEPWAFGSEVEDISRFHIGWRYRLLPYLYSLLAEAAATGAPALRPLIYEFQDDPDVEALGDQGMLGPWLLVAPVLEEGAAQRSIYLPAGRWYEYQSGAVYDGPTTLELPVTLGALPRYVREGAILPHGPLLQHTDAAPVDPLTLEVYPADAPRSFVLYEDAGDGFEHETTACYARTTYTAQRTADGAQLVVGPREGACPPAPRTLEIRVRRVDHPPTGVDLGADPLTGYPSVAELPAGGPGWAWDATDLSLVARLPDRDDVTLTFRYDPSLVEPRPWVAVPIRVQVPGGTPADPPIHVASSVDGWIHHPLAWAGPELATGTLLVPRGEWFWFKYTRGDWSTVEKWPACVEATDRYAFGAAHAGRDDVVFTWADWCP